MMNYVKKIIYVVCIISLMMGCSKVEEKQTNEVKLEETKIIYDEKFGSFYIDISIDDFNALGFEYGDCVTIELSDGHKLEEIPYYNGYYTRTNDPLICAYPGYAHIKVALNNGPDLYKEYNLNENITAKVTLIEKARFIDVQQAMDTVYLNERSAFESDEIFANYRALKGGNLKENIFYRSASCVDNEYNRASYVDDLMERDNIQLVINLSDNDDDIQDYLKKDDFKSDYSLSLYQNNKMVLLDMGSNYRSDAYKQAVATGLRAVINNDGPYLIHCVEGKDRTGFVAILIEALCGASYDEMLEDYMITYDNYYQINPNNKVNQYEAIVDLKFSDMMLYLAETTDLQIAKETNYISKAINYLLSAGMSMNEISELSVKLTDIVLVQMSEIQ